MCMSEKVFHGDRWKAETDEWARRVFFTALRLPSYFEFFILFVNRQRFFVRYYPLDR